MFESTALHPADPNADTDTWPLLELTDVMVVRYRRGHPEELVDLADVDEKGPFRVKGRLVDSGKKARSLGKPQYYLGLCRATGLCAGVVGGGSCDALEQSRINHLPSQEST